MVLSEKKWEAFFEMLSEIVGSAEKGWQDKKKEVLAQAKENGCDTELEEFLSWFDEQ